MEAGIRKKGDIPLHGAEYPEPGARAVGKVMENRGGVLTKNVRMPSGLRSSFRIVCAFVPFHLIAGLSFLAIAPAIVFQDSDKFVSGDACFLCFRFVTAPSTTKSIERIFGRQDVLCILVRKLSGESRNRSEKQSSANDFFHDPNPSMRSTCRLFYPV